MNESGELYGGLAAVGRHHAYGVFESQDVAHVLGRQRLEIKTVRRVKIGRDRLGVVIDDNYLVSLFFKRPHAMDARIVELDALPDPYRA